MGDLVRQTLNACVGIEHFSVKDSTFLFLFLVKFSCGRIIEVKPWIKEQMVKITVTVSRLDVMGGQRERQKTNELIGQ